MRLFAYLAVAGNAAVNTGVHTVADLVLKCLVPLSCLRSLDGVGLP